MERLRRPTVERISRKPINNVFLTLRRFVKGIEPLLPVRFECACLSLLLLKRNRNMLLLRVYDCNVLENVI